MMFGVELLRVSAAATGRSSVDDAVSSLADFLGRRKLPSRVDMKEKNGDFGFVGDSTMPESGVYGERVSFKSRS